MCRHFVFQHNFAVLSNQVVYPIDDLLLIQKDPPKDIYVGYPTVFKANQNQDGLQIGYQVMDIEYNLMTQSNIYEINHFPKSEYLFKIHHDSFNEIGHTYHQIEIDLEIESLNAIYHPILVFPLGLPKSMDEKTMIEIWTATDADYNSDYRRSEEITEVFPRKHFNFYTW